MPGECLTRKINGSFGGCTGEHCNCLVGGVLQSNDTLYFSNENSDSEEDTGINPYKVGFVLLVVLITFVAIPLMAMFWRHRNSSYSQTKMHADPCIYNENTSFGRAY